jgi:bifunctional DNase/RNase
VVIEVNIDSIRVSLRSQHRVIVLKEIDAERYLPIWIGSFEADAITIELQGVQVARPLTHDLLKAVILKMGATVSHILVNDLRNDTFYARIVMDVDGRQVDIDSRPSDAIALAVRVGAPIFVAESVMDAASIVPEEEVKQDDLTSQQEDGAGEEELSIFRDFVDSLDMDDLGPEES